MPKITDRQKLMEFADKSPDKKCSLKMCLGDLEGIGLPLRLFGFTKDAFVLVEGKEADKLNFCRQGLEPVIAFDVTAAQAFVLTHKLPKFRWAITT